MDDSRAPSQTHAPPRAYRVLMIAPTSFFADYGGHVRILEEARALQRLGHQVTIVTYHNGENAPGLDIRRTLPIPWRRDYEVGSSRHKIAFDALLGLKTLELLTRERFDVIHAHMHEGALIGLVLGRLFGLPVVFDFQGSMTEEMIDHHFLTRGSRVHRPLRRLERWIDHLEVSHILKKPYSVEPFPGYENILVDYSLLKTIIEENEESWFTALSNMKGVYLIADRRSGKQYVGSAYGEDAFWTRWSEYVKNGHGGNKSLRRLMKEKGQEYALNYQFSILEIRSMKTEDKEIIDRESYWKNVLQSREFGYNEN
jgi:hypothetical protein